MDIFSRRIVVVLIAANALFGCQNSGGTRYSPPINQSQPNPVYSPATSTPSIQTPEPSYARIDAVAECNNLAAHPDDPTKPENVVGVDDDNIRAGDALAQCVAALRLEPDNPRIQYQLARSYIAYDKPAEGMELMVEAAESGHPVAIASLGDIALYGILDDTPDPETAKKLYQQAADAGFSPAAELAANIEANPEEDKSQDMITEPEYHHPDRAAILLRGESIPGQGAEFVKAVAYAKSFLNGIKYECKNLEDTGIPPNAFANTIKNRMGFNNANDLISVLTLHTDSRNITLEQEATDDGYALAVSKGCKSAEIKAVLASFRNTFL